MSQSKQIKSSLFKYQTKSKKKKQRFIFDLTEIDKRFHITQSKDKNNEEKENINENENYNIKIDKIEKQCNINTQEIIPLKNSIYKDWKKWNSIFEEFEKELLDKKNYEINYDTFEIRTKNEKACEELKCEKFWIL